jgi:hypothetical protein
VKVVLFGATGMVGQGVLRECLLDPDVESVLAVVRNASLPPHDKLREIVHRDAPDLAAIEDRLSGYEVCFFCLCLGVSSVGMKEETYRRVTYDLTVSVAKTLAKLNPTMTFIYVSGAGTDSTERGRSMWVRVKGRTENALLQMPFKAVFLFRLPTSSRFTAFAQDQMVWGGLCFDETPLSVIIEDAFPELRDNDRMRRSRHAECHQARLPHLSLRIATSTLCARRTRNKRLIIQRPCFDCGFHSIQGVLSVAGNFSSCD